MHGDLADANRQDHRPVDDAGAESGASAEHRASEPCDRQHPEQAEEQRRHPDREFSIAEDTQRGGLGPEKQDRLVQERFTKERWRDEIAARDHFLRDGGVESFVRIEQRRVGDQRREDEQQCDRGEDTPQFGGRIVDRVRQGSRSYHYRMSMVAMSG